MSGVRQNLARIFACFALCFKIVAYTKHNKVLIINFILVLLHIEATVK